MASQRALTERVALIAYSLRVDDDADSRFLTPTEVKELLHVSRTTVHDWTVKGLLRAHTLPSGRRRYPANQPALRSARDALGVSS